MRKDDKKKEEVTTPHGGCDGIKTALTEIAELKRIASLPNNGMKDTLKELKEVRGMITDLAETSIVNKTNLENMTNSYKVLATDNSLTHYKLFSRTEKLKVSVAKVEVVIEDHQKHGDDQQKSQQHRGVYLLSMVAIGVSIVTAIIMAVQAGLFH